MDNNKIALCLERMCCNDPPYLSFSIYKPILRPHHLFRLLLTYHDPELVTYLNNEYIYWFAPYNKNEEFKLPNIVQPKPQLPFNPSRVIKNGLIPSELLTSMFATEPNLQLLKPSELLYLWDSTILYQDPTWSIFVLLAIFINIKPRLLALKGPELICDTLFSTIRALKDQGYYFKIATQAMTLRRSTPISVINFINDILADANIVDEDKIIEGDSEEWKERLIQFYSNYSPARVAVAEPLLKKYKGKEHLLELEIQGRYGIKNVLTSDTDYSIIDLGFCDLGSTLCLPISAKDVIIPLIDFKSKKNKYIIIDIRSKEEVAKGNIGGSVNIDPNLLDEYDENYKSVIDSIKSSVYYIYLVTFSCNE